VPGITVQRHGAIRLAFWGGVIDLQHYCNSSIMTILAWKLSFDIPIEWFYSYASKNDFVVLSLRGTSPNI
jgi:hypothetical protein